MRKSLVLLLALCLLTLSPFQAYADTLLIAPNPFSAPDVVITTPDAFLQFAEKCRLDSYSTGITVALEADIDLTGLDFSGIPIFSGSFNGNGHCISGLNITVAGSQQGLFRVLTETAVVANLTVKGAVTPGGSGSNVGGICGTNAGTILSCAFQGAVSGNDNIGGIAGSNAVTGIIEGCSTTGSIYGTHFIGGIAGESAGVIRDCENQADVNTTVEQNTVDLESITMDSLLNSETAATVTDIGGICGIGTGIIRNCVNLGNVGYPQIGFNIGGIAGRHSGYIDGCTNKGTICGRREVGGIAGQLEPAISMTFAKDTLQILQGQMDTMSALTDRTASHAQSSASALNAQLGELESHVGAVEGALDTLLPDEDDPLPPDPDTILAAQNTLASSLSAISGALESMGGTAEGALQTTYRDMLAISNQMNAIGSTLDAAEENLNGSVADVSDNDTDTDITGKIASCKNLGAVSAGWNTGGIVGAISMENDLDPESDLEVFGSTSANFACEFRAVITGCENAATVTGTKQNTGGIVGWMTLGLAKNCINAGTVSGNNYTGGIAGLSHSYVRNCITRSLIKGGTFVGGIAGIGATVTDCNALVRLADTKEKAGAILGSMDKDAILENNHYLPIVQDIGAVDGISYGGKANALDPAAFFALETLPEKFHDMTVTFRFDDGTVQTVTVPFGSKLGDTMIPSIPRTAGYESTWTGEVKVTDQLFFDTVFSISHTPHIQTLESQTVSADGRPMLLALGDFLQGQTVEIQESNGAWSLTLPESQTDLQLRFLLADTTKPEAVGLQLQQADGTWVDASFTVSGSYLAFTAPASTQALRLYEIPVNYTPYILSAGGLVLLVAIILIVIKKRKK